jgi:hypothetical protein
MALIHLNGGGFLYQHRPDLFPEGYLTRVELVLWGLFFEDKNRK